MKNGKAGMPAMTLTTGRRIMLMLCVTVLFYVITALALELIRNGFGAENVRALRISAVLQDLLMFVLPAVIVAILLTRLPARLLCVDTLPRPRAVLYAMLTMAVSVPAMNWIIAANAQLPLPEGIAETLRQAEATATRTTELMLGGSDVISLVMSLLIVAVLAGFSEELFFRGMMQRVFSGCRMNAGVAIWLTAILFSAMHMQVYGFVPRMLLGAYFGYLLLWSGSLWLPVLMHILNNASFIIARHSALGGNTDFNALGAEGGTLSYVIVGASVALTIVGLVLTRRAAKGRHIAA